LYSKKSKISHKSAFHNFKKSLAILLLIALGIYLWQEPLYTPTAIPASVNHFHFPKIIAHKALVSENFIGNTEEAIQEALTSYVEGIEVDVRISKDGIPFLYHSDQLENATNGRGTPEDHTWQQLQSLSYLPDCQSKIMSLEEALTVIGSQKYLFLDIKSSKILDYSLATKIVELIQKYHLQETVIVESFNPIFLITMRLKARDILLMYDFTVNATAIGEEVQTQFDKIPWLLKQSFFQKQVRRIVRPDILGPRWNVDSSLLKTLIANHYPIICWTVDKADTAESLFKIGVKGLQTNQPAEMAQITSQTKQTVWDAGGTKTQVDKIIHVKNVQDIIDAINEARSTHKSINIAGRRHSMGGQTLLKGAIHLNMLGLNSVQYHPEDQTVTVGAGTTWKKIQSILDEHGRSVKVMQSDNIFTVGGSISANVHGWQVNAPPIASTIKSLKILTADGHVRDVSAKNNPELFKAVIGGYGLFGVIIEAKLVTTANSALKFHCEFMKPEDFAANFKQHVTENPNVELAYGRLSVDSNHLFEEAGLFWYEKTHHVALNKITTEAAVALKRAFFRVSEYTELGKTLRWSAEKIYAKKLTAANSISRNNAMNSDIHILWPLYGQNKDILHEYFVPKDNLAEFLRIAKHLILSDDMNVLNVTIREIKQDRTSLLPYATQDVFGLVFLFSQSRNCLAETKMQQFTQKLIDAVIKVQGTFYLTYRLHYNQDQLLACYPKITEWLVIKQKWDQDGIFASQFFDYIQQDAAAAV